MKIALLSFGLLLVCGAGAQLTDAEYIRIADGYANLIGVDLDEQAAGVRRESSFVSVLDGRLFVNLDFDGQFLAFVDSKIRDPNPGAERYQTDEEAWRAVETLAARLGVPPRLERDVLDRLESGPKGRTIRCKMTERAHGYPAAPGNGVHAVIRRSDGAVLEFWVSRGWSSDPPDVRVSEAEAREIACGLYGGAPGSWSVSLRYIPDERRPKTQRLAYTMGRGQPGGSIGLIVDAKTGEVIRHGRAGDHPTPPPGYTPGTVVEGWEPNPGPDPPKNFGKPLPTAVYVAIALTAVASVSLALLAVRRWLPR